MPEDLNVYYIVISRFMRLGSMLSMTAAVTHGHGHGHGIFILATHPKGT
jgi:hypothetical protein